jgi:hypothetical protein
MEGKRQRTNHKIKIGIIVLMPFILIMMGHTSQVLASEDLIKVTMTNLTESNTNQSVPSALESLNTNQTLSVPDTIFQKILSNTNQSINALENEDMEIAKAKISSVYSDLKDLAEKP